MKQILKNTYSKGIYFPLLYTSTGDFSIRSHGKPKGKLLTISILPPPRYTRGKFQVSGPKTNNEYLTVDNILVMDKDFQSLGYYEWNEETKTYYVPNGETKLIQQKDLTQFIYLGSKIPDNETPILWGQWNSSQDNQGINNTTPWFYNLETLPYNGSFTIPRDLSEDMVPYKMDKIKFDDSEFSGIMNYMLDFWMTNPSL